MISLTTLAAEKVRTHLERRGKGYGIKIGVKTTGCSGLAYVLEYVDDPLQEDVSFTSEGINIFVDPKASPYVNGMVLVWLQKCLNACIVFINPHEKDRCGCGESFRV